MIYEKPILRLSYLVLALSILNLSACAKNEEPPIIIEGDYCTYRMGPTGHVTSSMNIAVDTSERFNYILTNISGYDNTSEAFKNIGCDRINNRLVIPELTVLIGNSDSMKINGEGDIGQDGTIRIDISTSTVSNENNFSLYLNNKASYSYYNSYEGAGQNLSIYTGLIDLEFTTVDDKVHKFQITDSVNQDCNLSIPRQSLMDQLSNQNYTIEGDLFFGGNKVFGTLYYSASSWQNAQSIELNMN